MTIILTNDDDIYSDPSLSSFSLFFLFQFPLSLSLSRRKKQHFCLKNNNLIHLSRMVKSPNMRLKRNSFWTCAALLAMLVAEDHSDDDDPDHNEDDHHHLVGSSVCGEEG